MKSQMYLKEALLWPEALIPAGLGGTGSQSCVEKMESCRAEQKSSYIMPPLPPKPEACPEGGAERWQQVTQSLRWLLSLMGACRPSLAVSTWAGTQQGLVLGRPRAAPSGENPSVGA